jgi:hypothetical protein
MRSDFPTHLSTAGIVVALREQEMPLEQPLHHPPSRLSLPRGRDRRIHAAVFYHAIKTHSTCITSRSDHTTLSKKPPWRTKKKRIHNTHNITFLPPPPFFLSSIFVITIHSVEKRKNGQTDERTDGRYICSLQSSGRH